MRKRTTCPNAVQDKKQNCNLISNVSKVWNFKSYPTSSPPCVSKSAGTVAGNLKSFADLSIVVGSTLPPVFAT